jgi:hypothetical protein
MFPLGWKSNDTIGFETILSLTEAVQPFTYGL